MYVTMDWALGLAPPPPLRGHPQGSSLQTHIQHPGAKHRTQYCYKVPTVLPTFGHQRVGWQQAQPCSPCCDVCVRQHRHLLPLCCGLQVPQHLLRRQLQVVEAGGEGTGLSQRVQLKGARYHLCKGSKQQAVQSVFMCKLQRRPKLSLTARQTLTRGVLNGITPTDAL